LERIEEWCEPVVNVGSGRQPDGEPLDGKDDAPLRGRDPDATVSSVHLVRALVRALGQLQEANLRLSQLPPDAPERVALETAVAEVASQAREILKLLEGMVRPEGTPL
jgi:hypothetical protein